MRRTLLIPIVAALAVGATAADSARRTGQSDLEQALAGRTAGAPTDCISLSRNDGPNVVDRHNILYRESGHRLWRNNVTDTCPFLRPDTILIVDVYGSQICRNDRFRVLDRGGTIPSAYCRFGTFTPYDKPKG